MLKLVFDKAFSSGNPTYAQFTNGRFCKVCGCLTEHRKENGFLICEGCETKTPYLKKARPDYAVYKIRQCTEAAQFKRAIAQSIYDSELEVVLPLFEDKMRGRRLFSVRLTYHWCRFRAIFFDGNRRLSELENLYQMENSVEKTRLSNQNIIENLADMEGN